jgi:hypothetical protein
MGSVVRMLRLAFALATLVLVFGAATAAPAEPPIQPLPASLQKQLRNGFWRPGCPVPLAKLRLLTVRHWGFDGKPHTGQLVVHEAAAAGLRQVFAKLYALRFQIRAMQLPDAYGQGRAIPDTDVTASFECRRAVPSPCNGGRATGNWSNHAYGLAIDVNPAENPYVGCGMTRDPKRLTYTDRSRMRQGMVTPAVVKAFAAIGWGWGGSWRGDTKDYMHFSHNGH